MTRAPSTFLTDLDKSRILALWRSGMLTPQIAREIGRNSQTVRGFLIRKRLLNPVSRGVRPSVPLTIPKVPAALYALLNAAAARRKMKIEQLVIELLTGVVYRGSIHKTLMSVGPAPTRKGADESSASAQV
jgi:hypothetical protein